jgi:undecaprenyl diphosphate synthase
MTLLLRTIRRERKTLNDNNIRLQAIGDLAKLPERARRELQEALEATAGNTRMTLVLALSYSGRWELVEAMRTLARRARQGTLDPEAIDEALVAQTLDSAGIPDPDLLIRTGGDYRISNFLLWQLAYTEMVITERYWPAFRRDQLYEAVRAFQHRDRRFGRIVS